MAVITDAPDDELDFDPMQPRGQKRSRARNPVWSAWLHQAFLCCFATQDSGPTGSRPTTELWIGRRYFDTTLGKPVYLRSTGPNVWVDGVGTVS